MSTKISTRPQPKRVQIQTRPKTKTHGLVNVQCSRMVFDDSTYAGKYVFNITNNQLERLREMETVVDPDATVKSWNTNSYGNQLKVTGDTGIEKGAYDLQLKVFSWSMGAKCGIGYRVVSHTKVEDISPQNNSELKNLGVCLI